MVEQKKKDEHRYDLSISMTALKDGEPMFESETISWSNCSFGAVVAMQYHQHEVLKKMLTGGIALCKKKGLEEELVLLGVDPEFIKNA